MKNLINILENLGEDEWRVLEVLTGITAGDIGEHIKSDRDANYFLTIEVPGWEDENGKSPVISPERVLAIVKAIVKDGYDIYDFELYDIPEPHVLCFGDDQGERMFDIISEDDGRCHVSYCIQDPENPKCLLMKDASSISEAIEKYVDLDTMPV